MTLRIIGTLAGSGTIAGLLLVFVFEATLPAISAHKAEVLRQAITEVLGGAERYEDVELADGKVVYRGFDKDDKPVGYAIVSQRPGFQDNIRVIFGYDPGSGRILGMRVLESKETPGLGDKIEKDDAFVGQFRGAETPLVARRRGKEGNIDTITGATISSRAILRIINEALERWGPQLP